MCGACRTSFRDFAEAGRGAVLEGVGLDTPALDGHGPYSVSAPVVGGVAIRPELTDRLGLPVVGKQLIQPKGPATVGHPVAQLEVLRVEGPAFAGPQVGGAAEVAGSSGVQVEIRLLGHRAGVERLGIRVGRQPAALEQHDLNRPTQELTGDRDARRAGPHDADIAVDH